MVDETKHVMRFKSEEEISLNCTEHRSIDEGIKV